MISLKIAVRYLFGNIFSCFFNKSSKLVKKESEVSFSSFFPIVALALSISVLVVSISINNGFVVEVVKRILGFNGHVVVHNNGHPIDLNKYSNQYLHKNNSQSDTSGKDVIGNDTSGKDAGKSFGEQSRKVTKEKASKLTNVGYVSNERNVNMLDAIKSFSKVTAAYGVVKQQIIISGQDASGAILQGVSINDIENRPLIKESIDASVMKKFKEDENAVIIGNKLAEFIGIKTGDVVMVLCPQSRKLSLSNITPKIKYMNVVGTFDVGMSEYNSAFVFVHLSTAQSMFGMGDSINEIDIFIEDPNNSHLIKNDIQPAIGDYSLVDWKDVNDTFLSAIEMQRVAMVIFFCLVIIIATFSTIASITSMVQRKNREVAILRTIGFSKKSIVIIFLIIAEIIAAIGILLGITIGCIIASNLNNILFFLETLFGLKLFDSNAFMVSELPCMIVLSDLVYISLASFLLTFIASVYPAFKGAKVDPVTVLRHE